MEKENKSVPTLSISIFTIIIVVPLTFIIYNFKLENVSFLPNTFLKYAVSFLIALIVSQLIAAILNKLILLGLILIGLFIIKK